MLPERDLAWMAGLYDGEGYVAVRHNQAAGLILAEIAISMVDIPTGDHLCSLLDQLQIGYAYRTEHRREPDKHRPTWRIRVRSHMDALHLAQAFEPYSVTKKKLWVLVIEFTSCRVRFSPYADRERAIAVECRALNRRGPGRVCV